MAIFNSANDAHVTMNHAVLKEDYDEDKKQITKSLRGIATAIAANHNQTRDWEKRSMIIGGLISLIIVVSLVTSIIQMNIYVDQINANLVTMQNLIVTQNETMENLRTDIQSMNEKIAEMTAVDEAVEEEIKEIEEVVEPEPIIYNYTDITSKSGFTAEQFDTIIQYAFEKMGKSSTKLTDIGAGLYAAENEYNINGLYLLGIASIESGWGTSGLATKSNNIYGLIGMKFNSVDDCSMYMGKLLRNSYIDKGYNTLNKIQTKYCPNSTKWVGNVTWCANKYISAAQELYPQ